MMFERIKHMLIKEFIQLFRDRAMRAIIFVVPLIQTFIFGYAVTTDIKHISMGVYDLDQTVSSRDVIARLKQSGYFDIVTWITSDQGVREAIDEGIATVVIQMNSGFEADIKAGKPAPIQVILDGTDSNNAGVIYGYIGQTIQSLSQQIFIHEHPQLAKSGLNLESRAWFNPNLESRNFYVPGVFAIMITLMTLTLTSMAIVREKEVGTIDQIIVTPITKAEFILGKTAPFIIIGFINVNTLLLIAIFWFKVPLQGSLLLLYFAAGLYLLTTLGIGLFISTISQTQQQAMMSALLFYFPAVLLSGFIFPIANMPVVIQWFTYINPLKYFLIVIRGIFLKGIGWTILWPQLLVLGVMGVFILWLATRRFKKTMA